MSKPDSVERHAFRIYEAVLNIMAVSEIYPDSAFKAGEMLLEVQDDIYNEASRDPDDRQAMSEYDMVHSVRNHLYVCFSEKEES